MATTIQARLPLALYQTFDAYCEAFDLTVSEATRRLFVRAFEDMGVKNKTTDSLGTYEDDSWKQPLPPDDAERTP